MVPQTTARPPTIVGIVDCSSIAALRQLKHVIDWASRPFGAGALKDKPVAVISISPSGYGAVRAGEAVCRSLAVAGVRVIEEIDLAIGGAATRFDEHGALIDAELTDQLGDVLTRIADLRTTLLA